MREQDYLNLLAKSFPCERSAKTEIVNLQAILNLPKGTEHFLSDIHGEYEVFLHILKNASGVIREKIEKLFGKKMSEDEKKDLAFLIYYPLERMEILKKSGQFQSERCRGYLKNMLAVCRAVSSKYTRSKIRKAIPKEFEYVLDELLHATLNEDKEQYYDNIIDSILSLGSAEAFIEALAELIQRLTIDKLHIIGDIFDRGGGADIIIDKLMRYHSIDLQWGNHDILWMGASFGNEACIANVLRINCAYNNLRALENGYGISLRPLTVFAEEQYRDCKDLEKFAVHPEFGDKLEKEEHELSNKMHKAITVIQMKLENQLIQTHPEYDMQDRKLFPESELNEKEKELMKKLKDAFTGSKRLKEHIHFLCEKGSSYLVYNGNLLMHGCVPTDENGNFTKTTIGKERYSGKALYDKIDATVRAAKRGDAYGIDYMWYLWCGKNSPFYGRDKMNIYEKYFTNTPVAENKNAYYRFVKEEWYCNAVLEEFGSNPKTGHIINGHMPVKVKLGEAPVSSKGKHITIDGGLSKAYHTKTGIAGYTLISDSHALFLVSHFPFCTAKESYLNLQDLHSKRSAVERYARRVTVRDTDTGKLISSQINCLKSLVEAYQSKTIQKA